MLFIVESRARFWEDLARQINSRDCRAFCGSVRRVAPTLEALRRLDPCLALLDISTLPLRNGLELIKNLRARNRMMKLLVMSTRDEPAYSARVLRLGADGYILHDEASPEIVRAMCDLLNGYLYLSDRVMTSACPAPATN